MSLPMLQVALDNQTMDSAYETTRLIAEEVDIIEVGTILCVGEGVRAVRDLKALYPHKIVLADAKIADAGKILSRMCFEANADWVTVICCADINTAKGALDVAKEFNGDVQIELTGYWTWEQAKEWRDAGIGQVVYHRSRDAQAAGVAWGEADITAIKRLSDMGFKVTVTGGLALEDLPLFAGIPIHVFIAGRSIRDAASPVEAARQFKRSIAQLWGRREGSKFNGVSYPVQCAAAAVFTEEGQKQTRANIEYYQNNAKVMASTLDELGIKYTGGKNSPYIWLKCPNNMGSWEFFDYLLENANVVGTPGAGFGKNGEGWFRLTAFGDKDRTVEAMERIKKLLSK